MGININTDTISDPFKINLATFCHFQFEFFAIASRDNQGSQAIYIR